MTPEALRDSPGFAELLAVSERLGRNPLQVQGPGGNSSIKADGVMWVKASGTWLADAGTQDIMVAVDAGAMKTALAEGAAEAGDASAFALGGGGLRPSIETGFHAALDWPVVLHTHCVATLAIAIREDAETVIADRLAGLGAVFVPYIKPGIDLARAILDAVTPETQVVVLGNHGLLVAAQTPAEAEALITEVSARLEPSPSADPGADPDPAFVRALEGSGFLPVPHGPTQAVALDPALLAMAEGTTLYPDHLIFLGPGIAVARDGETVRQAAEAAMRDGPPRHLILVPGQGAALPATASPSMLAMAAALGDVLTRVPRAARLTRLGTADEHVLLNWDAEKHRQALEAARARS